MFLRSAIFIATALVAVVVFAPGVARAGGLEEWGRAYCPNAMPAKHNPYWDERARYIKLGAEEKAAAAWEKASKYGACQRWTQGTAYVPMLAYGSHKVLIEDSMIKAAALYTKEATREGLLENVAKGTARYDVVSRVVELGYSEIAEKPADEAVEIVTRKTFCTCLAYPTKRIWRETHQ